MQVHETKKFTDLIQEVSGAAKAYARYICWNSNDMEDIFQVALFNAYKKFDTFKKGTNFKAWFFKFISYAAYNANRKYQNIGKHEYGVEPEELSNISAVDSLDNEFMYDQLLHHPERFLETLSTEVKEALKLISLKRRNIFLLRSVADFSYNEIADVLGIPIGTVMGELSRARKDLRVALCNYVKEKGILGRKK